MSDYFKVFVELADVANCVAGDFHCMHLNFTGADFDTQHKETLKKYYEEASEDYDSLAEFARCGTEEAVPTPNGSAVRLDYKSCEGLFDISSSVERTAEILEAYVGALKVVFKHLNEIDECPIAIGVSNWLQGRIEYWMKEMLYFNSSRRIK